AGRQQRQARQVGGGGAALHGGAHHHILDLGGLDAGALHRGADGNGGHGRRLEVVEGAAEGLGDRRAGGGNDDGVLHDGILCCGLFVEGWLLLQSRSRRASAWRRWSGMVTGRLLARSTKTWTKRPAAQASSSPTLKMASSYCTELLPSLPTRRPTSMRSGKAMEAK